MSNPVFDERELFQDESNPPRKPNLRRFKGDVRYKLIFDQQPEPTYDDCKIKGCLGQTTYKKPYCLAHLGRLPYVKALLQKAE